ncbi:hypothetical protein E2C01_065645 [Portunus trituberculatus]|uniref:Uncharacterized protein n=1 Tax=Portunus trituberculatus TaxID=210409 RepID=A0A5B7HRP3_PORTR|nr:hypothetical protein [Portunus trituberculatus]
MSSAPTHTRRLDAVKRRALCLLGEDEEIAASITSLDVVTLTVCHKAWVQNTLRLSLPPQSPGKITRQEGTDTSMWWYLPPTPHNTSDLSRPGQRVCGTSSRWPHLW